MKDKPICFVIMGFGKKVDHYTGRTLDMDKSYKNIIKPAVVHSGYECIRADEITDSGLIDKSMYALLMQADLVIADISTYNPNAIYELGVRHAVRPYSTIILKEKEGEIPFDLDHSRIFQYSHLGKDIGATEAERCISELKSIIKEIKNNATTDSPLYEYMSSVVPPVLPEVEYRQIVNELAVREKHIFALVEYARDLKSKGEFEEAAKIWQKAVEKAENEPYFIQQWALCTYKSKKPSEKSALIDALKIIDKLKPDGKTNDPETLGITGAIYKRFWLLENEIEMLNRALNYYGKCFAINSDYYTGENYALCLNMMGQQVSEVDEKTFYRIQAKKIRERIITLLNKETKAQDFDQRNDKRWIFATFSHCLLALGNENESREYEQKFMDENPDPWEIATFKESKNQLLSLIS